MTTRSFASLAFKLLGAYMLVLSVGVAMSLYYSSSKPIGFAFSTYIITLLLPFVLAVTFGVALIAKSNLLARWAVTEEGKVEDAAPVERATETLAFSVLGVAIFVSALVGLVSTVALLMTRGNADPQMLRVVVIFQANWPVLTAELVELAIGAYLVFGFGSSSKLWHRILESKMPALNGEQKP
jgi:hypothetical protein